MHKQSIALPERDHYGNEWRLTRSGQLEVVTPDAEVVVVWDHPNDLAQSVATDDHGFVWLIAGEKVRFSNPRAIADIETPDASPKKRGSAGTFTAVNPELLPGTPTRLQRSDAGMMLVQCILDDGNKTVIELQVKGQDIGGPFTSGHTTEVTASVELTPANADWEVLPARLPCGTHDNYCTAANGRVFVVGGATHYCGFPAVAHLHNELLTYDTSDTDAGWVVVGRIPEGYIYSAMATLDDRIYVIGGGGGGRPVRAECWTFNALSTCEATADRQPAPSLPSPRFGCVATAANGRIWVVGGTGGHGREPLCELLSIAPGETEWRIEPPAPVELPVATLAGCELNDIFYLLGGYLHVFCLSIRLPARGMRACPITRSVLKLLPWLRTKARSGFVVAV